jgi:protein involved in polysaccharide export with SLBB domain
MIKRSSIVSLCIALCLSLFSLHSTNTLAVQPSKAQIEQFKRLPPGEQQAMAAQFGVNLADLGIGVSTTAQANPGASDAPQKNNRRKGKVAQQAEAYIEQEARESTDNVVITEERAKTAPHEALQQFGYDLFKSGEESFTPVTDSAIPNDYIMGPGDSLVVQLYGKENASHALTINREGQVQFPNIGPINLAGLKFSQAQALLTRTVKEQMIGVKSAITMGTLRSIRIFVLGDVSYPGSYVVSSLSTMTNALFASGGISKVGSLRDIQLKRDGEIITRIDLYDLLLKGDTSKDSRLLPGDVLFVPPIGKTAGISGEVRRPAIYEIKNEKTVDELITLAGGLRPKAHLASARIERITDQGERTIVDLDLSNKDKLETPLHNADVLQILPVLDEIENVVILQGHVKRPGPTAWKAGLRVSDVIHDIQELLPNPDTRSALIEREIPETRSIEAVSVNLLKAIENPGSQWDITLNPRDTLTVFNFEDDRQITLYPLLEKLKRQANRKSGKQVIRISGHVKFPGEYPLLENMNGQQLINLAGGLTENAYSLLAEVSRYSLDQNERRHVEHLDLNLNAAEQYKLISEDHLRIKRLPDWLDNETVQVNGEVLFPGTYSIRRDETLSQLIQRAGGLTHLAHMQGAIFTRKELQELEAERLQELQRRLEADIAASNIEQQETQQKTATADAERVLKNLSALKPVGRMVIDLPQLLANSDNYDITLTDGDSITIPKVKQSVTVIGEVQYPTSHLYESTLNTQDYIERSGGTNERADKHRTYVVKANGRVFLPKQSGWFKSNAVNIEAGDTVVVPLDADRIKPLTLWTNASQIFYQIALGAAAVASF